MIAIAGAASLRALSHYCEAAGYAIRACRPEDLEHEAAPAALVIADARTLSLRDRRLPGEARIIALTGLGESGEESLLAAGAVLFLISDLAVARHRFVAPGPVNKVWGQPTYFAAQLLIAWSTLAQ